MRGPADRIVVGRALLILGVAAVVTRALEGTCPYPGCPAGTYCTAANATMCASSRCAIIDQITRATACLSARCDDNIQNGYETGYDCGGGCKGCDEASGCFVGQDCRSGVCSNDAFDDTIRCRQATCRDHVQNGNEPDVDCGQGCCQMYDDISQCPFLCEVGQKCLNARDCISGRCFRLPRMAGERFCAGIRPTDTDPSLTTRMVGGIRVEGQKRAFFNTSVFVDILAFMLDVPAYSIYIEAVSDVQRTQEWGPTAFNDILVTNRNAGWGFGFEEAMLFRRRAAELEAAGALASSPGGSSSSSSSGSSRSSRDAAAGAAAAWGDADAATVGMFDAASLAHQQSSASPFDFGTGALSSAAGGGFGVSAAALPPLYPFGESDGAQAAVMPRSWYHRPGVPPPLPSAANRAIAAAAAAEAAAATYTGDATVNATGSGGDASSSSGGGRALQSYPRYYITTTSSVVAVEVRFSIFVQPFEASLIQSRLQTMFTTLRVHPDGWIAERVLQRQKSQRLWYRYYCSEFVNASTVWDVNVTLVDCEQYANKTRWWEIEVAYNASVAAAAAKAKAEADCIMKGLPKTCADEQQDTARRLMPDLPQREAEARRRSLLAIKAAEKLEAEEWYRRLLGGDRGLGSGGAPGGSAFGGPPPGLGGPDKDRIHMPRQWGRGFGGLDYGPDGMVRAVRAGGRAMGRDGDPAALDDSLPLTDHSSGGGGGVDGAAGAIADAVDTAVRSSSGGRDDGVLDGFLHWVRRQLGSGEEPTYGVGYGTGSSGDSGEPGSGPFQWMYELDMNESAIPRVSFFDLMRAITPWYAMPPRAYHVENITYDALYDQPSLDMVPSELLLTIEPRGIPGRPLWDTFRFPIQPQLLLVDRHDRAIVSISSAVRVMASIDRIRFPPETAEVMLFGDISQDMRPDGTFAFSRLYLSTNETGIVVFFEASWINSAGKFASAKTQSRVFDVLPKPIPPPIIIPYIPLSPWIVAALLFGSIGAIFGTWRYCVVRRRRRMAEMRVLDVSALQLPEEDELGTMKAPLSALPTSAFGLLGPGMGMVPPRLMAEGAAGAGGAAAADGAAAAAGDAAAGPVGADGKSLALVVVGGSTPGAKGATSPAAAGAAASPAAPAAATPARPAAPFFAPDTAQHAFPALQEDDPLPLAFAALPAGCRPVAVITSDGGSQPLGVAPEMTPPGATSRKAREKAQKSAARAAAKTGAETPRRPVPTSTPAPPGATVIVAIPHTHAALGVPAHVIPVHALSSAAYGGGAGGGGGGGMLGGGGGPADSEDGSGVRSPLSPTSPVSPTSPGGASAGAGRRSPAALARPGPGAAGVSVAFATASSDSSGHGSEPGPAGDTASAVSTGGGNGSEALLLPRSAGGGGSGVGPGGSSATWRSGPPRGVNAEPLMHLSLALERLDARMGHLDDDDDEDNGSRASGTGTGSYAPSHSHSHTHASSGGGGGGGGSRSGTISMIGSPSASAPAASASATGYRYGSPRSASPAKR